MTGSVIVNLTWLVVSFYARKTGKIGSGKRYFGKRNRVFSRRKDVTLSTFTYKDAEI